MTDDIPIRRVCESTGLTLTPSQAVQAFRIAKESYGPMNPPVRRVGDRGTWGRYDVINHRTIYAGSPQEGSYAESLAFARPAIDVELQDLFDEDDSFGSIEDEVLKEWSERHHMPPGQVAAAWRQERKIHQLELPATGWFVEIETADSIAALTRHLAASLSMAGIERLTTAHLRGENRALTTSFAEWIHKQVLDDGSLPLGIVYGSKHDSDWRNWAIWLRAVDDGKSVSSEPTRVLSADLIDDPGHNEPLQRICGLFMITCH